MNPYSHPSVTQPIKRLANRDIGAIILGRAYIRFSENNGTWLQPLDISKWPKFVKMDQHISDKNLAAVLFAKSQDKSLEFA